MAARHPQVELLMTIPGVGIRTAEAFMAYVDDIRRFTRINCIGSYFGMIPARLLRRKTPFRAHYQRWPRPRSAG